MADLQNKNIIHEIKTIINTARDNVARNVNKELLYSYWEYW